MLLHLHIIFLSNLLCGIIMIVKVLFISVCQKIILSPVKFSDL